MADFRLSNKALGDLSDIWEYTLETWSEFQADKYYHLLLETCQDLANGTIKGKSYPEIDSTIIGFNTGKHIIFYRKSELSGIDVARILHSRMDLKMRIRE